MNKKICLYCDKELDIDNVIKCENCGSHYHKECLENLGEKCINCGNEISISDSSTVEEPLKEVSVNNYDATLNDNINEYPPKNKKNKKMLIAIISIILVFIICIIWYASSTAAKKKAREEYLSNVYTFSLESYLGAYYLENVSSEIITYWHEFIFEDKHGSSIDDAVQNAIYDNADNISNYHAMSDDLEETYVKLQNVPKGSEDLQIYKDTCRDVYDSYTSFLNAVDNPTGNYQSFTESISDKKDDYISNYNSLSNLIKSNPEFDKLKEKTENK